MDGKVILTIFGVLLLLAAVFFFFKSFTSHEARMQEEQRARIELERQKLEAEKELANRPLTPEEIARRKVLAEEKKKADEARRVATEAQRKESEKKRLEDQIQAEKNRAEEEKRRIEEQRQADGRLHDQPDLCVIHDLYPSTEPR